MDRGSIFVVHLVKLVDQANTFVSQYQGTSFESPLTSHWISMYSRSQSYSTCSFTSGVDHSWIDLLNILEELRLGCSRVSEKQHVDITSNLVLSSNILRNTTKHGKGKPFLNELMAKNARSDRLKDLVGDSRLL